MNLDWYQWLCHQYMLKLLRDLRVECGWHPIHGALAPVPVIGIYSHVEPSEQGDTP